jgi:exosome complex component RRP42
MDGQEVHTSDEVVPLPVQNEPVAVTTAKIDGQMILDPCLEEELAMSSRLTVTTGRDSNICAMQKGGLGTFTDQEIRLAVKTSIEKGKEIRETIRGAATGT